MVISVASGKGGTGKTTVSVSLALSAERPVTLLDCDVEGANDALFLRCVNRQSSEVTVLIPHVVNDACTGCGECLSICAFNAIVVIKGKALVCPDLCHSCGGCVRVCQERAIIESPFVTGSIEQSECGNITLYSGELTVGNAMSPPVIRQVKTHIGEKSLTIIDSPPGTSCPMIAAIKGSDFVLLVTEPTPFGHHDLKLAVRTVRMLSIPFGVIINRCDAGDDRIERYCIDEGIEIMMLIPSRRDIAENCSRGKTLLDVDAGFRHKFSVLLDDISFHIGRSL